MLRCFECQSAEYFRFEDFKSHIQLEHKFLMVYTCNLCLKKFQSRKSFFKHIRKNTVCSGNFNSAETELGFENQLEPENVEKSCSNILLVNSSSSSPEIVETGNSTVNDQNFESLNLESIILSFISELYGDFGMSRKDAENIISKLSDDLLIPILKFIENTLDPLISGTDRIKFITTFQDIKNIIKTFSSFHLYLKYVTNKGFYVEPLNIEINNVIAPVIRDNQPTLDQLKTYETLMPMKHQFQKFFELPGVLKLALDSMHGIINDDEHNNITSIIDGDSWKNKIKNREGHLIAYDIYFDELEIDNPLGSHSGDHTLGDVYYNFPTLPKEFVSQLNNIFVGLVYESKNKVHGNGVIFQHLIDEMNLLNEEGLDFELNGEKIRVHFILHVITGDNAGLNLILGYTRSPSANFYCRNCKCSKLECQNLCIEDASKLRNIQNYHEDINSEFNIEKRAALSGIRENSIFNKVASFHVTENYTMDIMHDLFEGEI